MAGNFLSAAWWKDEHRFFRSSRFWWLALGVAVTVTAVVLSGGTLLALVALAAIPLVAIATERNWLNIPSWREWWSSNTVKKYNAVKPEESSQHKSVDERIMLTEGKTLLPLDDSSASTIGLDEPKVSSNEQDESVLVTPPHARKKASEERDIKAYHTRLFLEGLLLLKWLRAPFCALPEEHYDLYYDQQTEINELFSEVYSLRVPLYTYETARQNDTDFVVVTNRKEFEDKASNASFLNKTSRLFHSDRMSSQPIPESLTVFNQPIRQATVSTLYNLICRVFQTLKKLPSLSLSLDWSTPEEATPSLGPTGYKLIDDYLEELDKEMEASDERIRGYDASIARSEASIIEHDASIARNKARVIEHEESIARNKEASRISKANAASCHYDVLTDLKFIVATAKERNNFAVLHEMFQNNPDVKKEELLNLVNHEDESLRLTPEELAALRKENLLPLCSQQESLSKGPGMFVRSRSPSLQRSNSQTALEEDNAVAEERVDGSSKKKARL